ncbi:hypothetical protein LZ30DRAFT_200629 [Colletotrichum cereale]|nr:hypothetical protein LZ30DRAFT_200629 [Colletotrichum cereale]
MKVLWSLGLDLQLGRREVSRGSSKSVSCCDYSDLVGAGLIEAVGGLPCLSSEKTGRWMSCWGPRRRGFLRSLSSLSSSCAKAPALFWLTSPWGGFLLLSTYLGSKQLHPTKQEPCRSNRRLFSIPTARRLRTLQRQGPFRPFCNGLCAQKRAHRLTSSHTHTLSPLIPHSAFSYQRQLPSVIFARNRQSLVVPRVSTSYRP